MTLTDTRAHASHGSSALHAQEQALVERARTDRLAFGELYRQHSRAIHGHVLRRVRDPHAAEDLVAEVFLHALDRLPKFEQRGIPFRHWLFGIAARRVGLWLRSRPRESGPLDQETSGAVEESTVDGERVRAALATIAPRYQSALTLFYFHDLSVAEICKILRCRPGTVKSRLQRGRAILERKLTTRRNS